MAGKRKQTAGPPAHSDARLVQMTLKQGAIGAKVVAPSSVETGAWVRWKCQFGCGGYGSSLVCPPHTPTPDQTRTMLDGYERAILFEAPPDWPRVKEIAVKLERRLFLSGHYKALGLGAGPCRLCEACAFDAGCRHARQARPSMEACGIDVYATARKHGFTIDVVRTRNHPQHYFGLVLIE
jgi:predicted metal-binding protein